MWLDSVWTSKSGTKWIKKEGKSHPRHLKPYGKETEKTEEYLNNTDCFVETELEEGKVES